MEGSRGSSLEVSQKIFRSQLSLTFPSQDMHYTHVHTYTCTHIHCYFDTPYFCLSNFFFFLLFLTWQIYISKIWHWFQLLRDLFQDSSGWIMRLSSGSPELCIDPTATISWASLDFNLVYILATMLWLEHGRYPIKVIWADLKKGHGLQNVAHEGRYRMKTSRRENEECINLQSLTRRPFFSPLLAPEWNTALETVSTSLLWEEIHCPLQLY